MEHVKDIQNKYLLTNRDVTSMIKENNVKWIDKEPYLNEKECYELIKSKL